MAVNLQSLLVHSVRLVEKERDRVKAESNNFKYLYSHLYSCTRSKPKPRSPLSKRLLRHCMKLFMRLRKTDEEDTPTFYYTT